MVHVDNENVLCFVLSDEVYIYIYIYIMLMFATSIDNLREYSRQYTDAERCVALLNA